MSERVDLLDPGEEVEGYAAMIQAKSWGYDHPEDVKAARFSARRTCRVLTLNDDCDICQTCGSVIGFPFYDDEDPRG